MRYAALRPFAIALIILLSVIPSGLSAKEKRGADLIVTKLDGTRVSGELIAVRPDSLLLLSAGKDMTVDLTDVETVRIVRKSRTLLFGGIGTAVGLAGAGILVGGAGPELDYGAAKVLAGGGIGLLAGAIAGTIKGIDPKYTVTGQSEAAVARYWKRLASFARDRN
jgi:hypothetical protein